MFTSSADVFRRRQAVSDLNSVVRAHRSAMSRLGVTGAEREAIAEIVSAGSVLTGPEQDRIASQLLLTAALPDDDFNAFVTATAILVVNRLSGGRGDDDLFWNWDAFQEHYRLAEPPVRAALMNGFRVMDRTGLVTLDGGPTEEDCLSLSRDAVLDALGKDGPAGLASAIATEVSGEVAGRLWNQFAPTGLAAPALSGFRYLYERPRSMVPELPSVVPVIPWG